MRVPGEAERSEAPVVEDPRHVAAPAHPIGGLEAPGGKAARTAAVRAYPVLLLQASAGNAAVSAMLARQEPAVAEPPAEAPDAGAGNRPMLRQGARGSAVVDAQERLNTANPPAEQGLALDVPGLLRGVHASAACDSPLRDDRDHRSDRRRRPLASSHACAAGRRSGCAGIGCGGEPRIARPPRLRRRASNRPAASAAAARLESPRRLAWAAASKVRPPRLRRRR